VILLDLMMPVLSGWQLRDALRKEPALARIPQLVISAFVDEAEQVVLALPPDDCIRKPFTFASSSTPSSATARPSAFSRRAPPSTPFALLR